MKGPAKPLQIKGAGLPGILMLQGTLDPATPYAGAQNAHKLLPSARMVVVEGGGNHGQSMEQPSDTCVQGYLNSYLATGALPSAPGPVNATCPPSPPRRPKASGSQRVKGTKWPRGPGESPQGEGGLGGWRPPRSRGGLGGIVPPRKRCRLRLCCG